MKHPGDFLPSIASSQIIHRLYIIAIITLHNNKEIHNGGVYCVLCRLNVYAYTVECTSDVQLANNCHC